MTSSFSYIDGLILVSYLIIIMSIGFYYSRKKETSPDDYFLAGRNAGWLAIGLSLFATNISSEHFLGLAGSGAARGLVVGQFELMAVFILFVLGWFIAPIFIKSGIMTMPEFLEQRYDRRSRNIFTWISIAIYIFTKITVTLYASGIIFNQIFGFNMYTSAIIVVFITGVYSVTGGATAIMKTHSVQAVLMIVGAVLLTVFGLNAVGGFAVLKQRLPADYFSMFKPASDPDFPWTGVVFGMPILAFWYWCTDQYMVQRVLCARSINDARRGSLLAACLKILPLFILVLPGLIAAVLFTGINGDEAYPALIASDLLPMGIKGIVLAGLLAAIMSSLAGIFNSTATLFTNDVYKVLRPESSTRKLVLVGRLATMTTAILAIICVPLVKMVTSQSYIYLQNFQSAVSPPIAAVFLLGLISKRVNAKGALVTFIAGEAIGMFRFCAELYVNANHIGSGLLFQIASINFLHFAVFSFVFSAVLLMLISYLVQRVKAEKYENKLILYFTDNFSEIRHNLLHPAKALGSYKTNFIFSAFIILVILGVWTLWN